MNATTLVRWRAALLAALAAAFTATVPAAAQPGGAQDPEALRRAAHGRALARIGRSGLRSLLSASGSLGDLRNRAGSYRSAVQTERARTGPLRGRLSALESSLADPSIPSAERSRLVTLRDETRAELARVPAYLAAYRTATGQAEALVPAGFFHGRPLFLMVRARGHARWGGDDGLTVFSEGLSVGPVVLASRRWIVSPGLSVGRTDVEIGAFDGESGTTSVGLGLSAGALLGGGWSAAGQVGYGWARSSSVVQRPGPGGPTPVRAEGWSASTSAKAELKGRLALTEVAGRSLRLRPRVGGFVVSSRSDDGDGPFGARETVAALRAGVGLETSLGPWSPGIYAAWERELTDELSVLVDDPNAVVVSAGVSWSWTRGRRLSAEYRLLRGLEGLRRVSDFTVVLILDG